MEPIRWTQAKQSICIDRGYFIEKGKSGKINLLILPNHPWWPQDLPPWTRDERLLPLRKRLFNLLMADTRDVHNIHLRNFADQRAMDPPMVGSGWSYACAKLHWTDGVAPPLMWHKDMFYRNRVRDLLNRARITTDEREREHSTRWADQFAKSKRLSQSERMTARHRARWAAEDAEYAKLGLPIPIRKQLG